MAFTYQIFPEHHLRLLTMSAAISPDTVRASAQRLMASADYDPSHDVIVDFRPTAAVGLSAEFIAGLAREYAAPLPEVPGTRVPRLAVVTASDEQFGVGRMFAAYRGDTPARLQVFRSAAEACAWLGVPADLLP